MKVTKFLPVFVVGVLLLSACNSSTTETTPAPTQAETSNGLEKNAEDLTESLENVADELENAPTDPGTKSLEDLAAYLKENNIIEGEPEDIPAHLAGAIGGAKYDTVYLYEYDKDSDSYKGLLENGYVVIEGIGTKMEPNAINDKFMLICERSENKDEVIKVFMDYK